MAVPGGCKSLSHRLRCYICEEANAGVYRVHLYARVGYCCYCNTSSIAVVVFPYTGLYANLQLPVMSDAPSAVAHYTAYLVEPCRKIWLQGWSEGKFETFRDATSSADDDAARDAKMVKLLERNCEWALKKSGGRIQMLPRIAGWANASHRDAYGLRAERDRYASDSVVRPFLLGRQHSRFARKGPAADITVVLAEATCHNAGREATGGELPSVACHAVVMVVKVLARPRGQWPAKCQVFLWDPEGLPETEPVSVASMSPQVFRRILAKDCSWEKSAEYFWAHGGTDGHPQDSCLPRSLQFMYGVVRDTDSMLDTGRWKSLPRC